MVTRRAIGILGPFWGVDPNYIASLKLTAKAPENGWLEDDPFLLGFGLFSRAFAARTLGRVISWYFPSDSLFQRSRTKQVIIQDSNLESMR